MLNGGRAGFCRQVSPGNIPIPARKDRPANPRSHLESKLNPPNRVGEQLTFSSLSSVPSLGGALAFWADWQEHLSIEPVG
jgi:hypothetical protein